jgi:hypothetical protein
MAPSETSDTGDVRRIGQQGGCGRIWRDHLPPGWLALSQATEGAQVVTIADDVTCPDVAAVERHMATWHDGKGVEACRLPICAAVLTWRPCAVLVIDVASSA